MDRNNINRDRDTSGLGPIEYDQSKVPALIRKHADDVRTKTYGQEVREAQARNAEIAGLIANEAVDISNETKGRQDTVEAQFNSVQQEMTDKDVVSAPEIIAARNGEATLNDRLNKFEQNVIHMGLFKKRPTDIDDSERFQRAMNYAHSVKKPLVLNGGVYYVRMLNIPTGLTLIGNGATLKKPNLSAPPYNMTTGEMKWTRLAEVKDYSGDVDSDMTHISDLTFDGSCWDMWDTPSFAQEQASLLIAWADTAKKGRVKIRLDNCHFVDNVSDGIHLWTNVDAQINNCSSYDCFRGGLVITGGYTRVNVNNFSSSSNLLPDGIDVEVDANGYGGTRAVELNFNNITIDTDFDFEIPNDSYGNINNVILSKDRGTSYLGVGFNSILNVTNSRFVSKNSTTNNNRLLLSGAAKFKNCQFLARPRENSNLEDRALYIYSYMMDDPKGVVGKSWTATFDDCHFGYLGDNYKEVPTTGIYTRYSAVTTVIIENCHFDDTLSLGIHSQIKNLHTRNNRYACYNTALYHISNQYNVGNEIVIDNPILINKSIKYLEIESAGAIIRHLNTVLTDENSRIYGQNIANSSESSYYQTFIGNRLIYTKIDPTISPYLRGIPGDVAISTTPVIDGNTKVWRCVRSSTASSPYNSVWVEITAKNLPVGVL
ncbi:hypothetical protein [Aerococcus sp. 1KP-2016]|uniref:hypothetical protein n=1 Tax=Aerococcus sp. 1KP-2016 TaxID=1981982 RepID=UPI000B9806F9|nr:hypothetical protein [Aerococcus sp. 1KP-2016]OYQ68259.1 hypothetical protein B9P78_00165 [Aerococcus sp. 1KP-2016]